MLGVGSFVFQGAGMLANFPTRRDIPEKPAHDFP